MSAWLEKSHLRSDQFLFPSRVPAWFLFEQSSQCRRRKQIDHQPPCITGSLSLALQSQKLVNELGKQEFFVVLA